MVGAPSGRKARMSQVQRQNAGRTLQSTIIAGIQQLRQRRSFGPRPAGNAGKETGRALLSAMSPLSSPGHLRDYVYITFTDPGASLMARFISMVVLLTIMLSITTFVMDSVPQLSGWKSSFDIVEKVVIAIFTVEFGARLITERDRSYFCRQCALRPWPPHSHARSRRARPKRARRPPGS